MNRSPSAVGLLPLPGAPSSSWALYRARLVSLFRDADVRVIVAFWLFGLINNILYVLLLSAAQDLVGTAVPKGVVLLADVMPSFLTKLVAPYFIHRVPYPARIAVFVGLSSAGMLTVAFSPAPGGGGGDVAVKLLGVVLASLSSGGGELSFLGLTHYYGHVSLAAWGSGTGGAGLIGAGLGSLLVGAVLPGVMVFAFWAVLPRERLKGGWKGGYEPLERDGEAGVRDGEEEEEGFEDVPTGMASSGLLAPGSAVAATAYTHHSYQLGGKTSFWGNLRRARVLFFPYMLPLLLVYVAEYTINQGVAPTLLFPLEQSPFSEFREFYPFYGFLYQLGVFISRSSTPFIRIHHLYLPSLLQVVNLILLTLHALFNFLPSVYLVFVVVFWEGLLGGAVYVNTFAEIMERVPAEDREFSLGATSVSDSGGICIAGFLGMAMEVWLCHWQVSHGRDYCRRIEASSVP
ncbi:batten's disease protein Cln3 [Parathielavia appendiculata]|uniref:Protein BTN n=1 Tax=Parathielavia appendiculata TaxID=2587402 RepID=A0AAN6TXA2_9PEZI|nr:batten's disease protein Cln3 [Parathielavia appendiculata]